MTGGFKRNVIDLLQNEGLIVVRSSDNKSKFSIIKNNIQIQMTFGVNDAVVIQYYTKTKTNLKDYFDNGSSDTEIIVTVLNFFDTIANVQKIEIKIDKKQSEINKLKERILLIQHSEV